MALARIASLQVCVMVAFGCSYSAPTDAELSRDRAVAGAGGAGEAEESVAGSSGRLSVGMPPGQGVAGGAGLAGDR